MPTLSIGNISAGGTGKTPLLFSTLASLKEMGAEVGVLSRGYGGDEGRMLEERHPEVQLVENPDRRAGLRQMIARQRPELLLLDDGFQHLRLQRDLDVVLLDATRPFGRCIPAGLFRESARALRRAHAVVLSRTECVSPQEQARIWQQVDDVREGLNALPRISGGMRAADLRNLNTAEVLPLSEFAGKSVRLASGIGNPHAFQALVEAQGIQVQSHRIQADHHAWQASDFAGNADFPWLVTEKDGVKIRPFATAQQWELRAEWQFHSGQDDWLELLDRLYLPVRAARIEPLWAAQDPGGKEVY